MVTLKSFLGMIAAVPFIMACNQTGQVNATLFPASGSESKVSKTESKRHTKRV